MLQKTAKTSVLGAWSCGPGWREGRGEPMTLYYKMLSWDVKMCICQAHEALYKNFKTTSEVMHCSFLQCRNADCGMRSQQCDTCRTQPHSRWWGNSVLSQRPLGISESRRLKTAEAAFNHCNWLSYCFSQEFGSTILTPLGMYFGTWQPSI